MLGLKLNHVSKRGPLKQNPRGFATLRNRTVGCRVKAVQYTIIFHTALKWMKQNINQTVNSQKISHISPSRASYGMYIVRILKKIDCIITAPHCISIYLHLDMVQKAWFQIPVGWIHAFDPSSMPFYQHFWFSAPLSASYHSIFFICGMQQSRIFNTYLFHSAQQRHSVTMAPTSWNNQCVASKWDVPSTPHIPHTWWHHDMETHSHYWCVVVGQPWISSNNKMPLS